MCTPIVFVAELVDFLLVVLRGLLVSCVCVFVSVCVLHGALCVWVVELVGCVLESCLCGVLVGCVVSWCVFV